MKKEERRYMRYGKMVMFHGREYKLVADMTEEKETVKAVPAEEYRRFELLTAWSRNDVGLTAEQREELSAIPQEIPCGECEPANRIRFITSEYNNKFEVPDLRYILVNGRRRQVRYIDEYHFSLEGGSVFHICEFAEMCERNGISVLPLLEPQKGGA